MEISELLVTFFNVVDDGKLYWNWVYISEVKAFLFIWNRSYGVPEFFWELNLYYWNLLSEESISELVELIEWIEEGFLTPVSWEKIKMPKVIQMYNEHS
jgi:hypothetical protein